MYYSLIICMSLMLGALGAWLIYNYGNEWGIIDIPNERSSHTKIIPKGGGIGILAAFVCGGLTIGTPKSLLFSSFVVSIISFYGDRIDIKPKIRLAVQLICSTIFLILLFSALKVHYAAYTLMIPLAVFISGTANFYNFMDGINGIAGITGIVAFLLLAIWEYINGLGGEYVALSITMMAACLGFLPFNIPNARVFMGDVGSILLGFVFACIVVSLSCSFFDFICLCGFLFPFYADELTTMSIRIKNGDSLHRPHRKHIYQLLANDYGIAHWKISLGYGIAQLIIGVFILILSHKGVMYVIFLYILGFATVSFFAVYLRLCLNLSRQ